MYRDAIMKEFFASSSISSTHIPLATKKPFDTMFDSICTWPQAELLQLKGWIKGNKFDQWNEFTHLMQSSFARYQARIAQAASMFMVSDERELSAPIESTSLLDPALPEGNQLQHKRRRQDSTESPPNAIDHRPETNNLLKNRVNANNDDAESASAHAANGASLFICSASVSGTGTSDQLIPDADIGAELSPLGAELDVEEREPAVDASSVDNAAQQALNTAPHEQILFVNDASFLPVIDTTSGVPVDEAPSDVPSTDSSADLQGVQTPLSLVPGQFLLISDWLSLGEQLTKLGVLNRAWSTEVVRWSTEAIRLNKQTVDISIHQELDGNALFNINHVPVITMRWSLPEGTVEYERTLQPLCHRSADFPLVKLVVHETLVKNQRSFVAELLNQQVTGNLPHLTELELVLSGMHADLLQPLGWNSLAQLSHLKKFSVREQFSSGNQSYMKSLLDGLPPTITLLKVDRVLPDGSVGPFDRSACKLWMQKFASNEFLPKLKRVDGSLVFTMTPKLLHAVSQASAQSLRSTVVTYVDLDKAFESDDPTLQPTLASFPSISELEATLVSQASAMRFSSLPSEVLPSLRECTITVTKTALKAQSLLMLLESLATWPLTGLSLTSQLSTAKLGNDCLVQLRLLTHLQDLTLAGFEICWDDDNLAWKGCWPRLRILDLSCKFGGRGNVSDAEWISIQADRLANILSASQTRVEGGEDEFCWSGLTTFSSSTLDPVVVASALFSMCPYIEVIHAKGPITQLTLVALEHAWDEIRDDYPAFSELRAMLLSQESQSGSDQATHFLINKLAALAPKLSFFSGSSSNFGLFLRSRLANLTGLAPDEVKHLQQRDKSLFNVYRSSVRSRWTASDSCTTMKRVSEIQKWGVTYDQFLTSQDGHDGRTVFFQAVSDRLSAADKEIIASWDSGNYAVAKRPSRVVKPTVHLTYINGQPTRYTCINGEPALV